ncbi:zinc finger protein 271-like [Diabrotica virgifera virgifera]|uniref:C2H2-type domain-containing protein n=1 Tax=Diabrotica virgifera virgifera TaxID=50390 RepID=A0ABM5L342_DIAVI|nr:zinc finger protein 271-like [Diabrotica virgifera virgifera]
MNFHKTPRDDVHTGTPGSRDKAKTKRRRTRVKSKVKEEIKVEKEILEDLLEETKVKVEIKEEESKEELPEETKVKVEIKEELLETKVKEEIEDVESKEELSEEAKVNWEIEEEEEEEEEEYKEELPEDIFRKFACELCNEKISSSVDFALHSRKHSQDKRYHCHHCDGRDFKRSFKRVDGIRNHVTCVHGMDLFLQCDVCNMLFPETIQAFEHKNFDSGKMPYRCDVCQKSFMYSWDKAKTKRRRTRVKSKVKEEIKVEKEILEDLLEETKVKVEIKEEESKEELPEETKVKVEIKEELLETKVKEEIEEVESKEELSEEAKVNWEIEEEEEEEEEYKEELPEDIFRKFACELCDEKISSSVDFALHSRKHSQDKRYHCHHCDGRDFKRSFKRVDGIRNHVTCVHGMDLFLQCDVCNMLFPETIQAFEHKNFDSGKMPYRCDVCQKSFMYSWDKAKPKRRRARVKSKVKEEINVEETILENLLEETKVKVEIKEEESKQELPEENKVKVEIKQELLETKVKVEIKEELVETKVKEEIEEVESKEELPEETKVKKEIEENEEKEYKEETREDVVRKFACELCDEKISTSMDFALHSRKHSHDKKYHCHHCYGRLFKRSFQRVHALRRHITSSHGGMDPPIRCKVCKKSFPEWIQAFEHKNFDSGEMPYRCDMCHKVFMYSWLLFTHYRLFHPESKVPEAEPRYYLF